MLFRSVMVVDAGVAGDTNTSALVRHYLQVSQGLGEIAGLGLTLFKCQNDLTYGPNSDHSVLLVNTTAAITDYAGPAPPSGSGPHRYVVLAFEQPANFTPPAALSTAGTGVGRFEFVCSGSFDLAALLMPCSFSPNEYISSTGLILLAAQYFTVEVGTATVSVASTSAVDSTTLPQVRFSFVYRLR